MDISSIEEEWVKDSYIDSEKLFDKSLELSKLHSKWSSILLRERVILVKMKSEQQQLSHILEQFYNKTLTIEELKLHNLEYTDKRIAKPEIQKWVDNNDSNVKSKLKIGLQIEKVKMIESIMQQISQMSFNIKNAIEDKKFMNGSTF